MIMGNLNPWHDVAIGNGQPERVGAIIEIPKGSKAKYGRKPCQLGFRASRPFHSAIAKLL